MEPTQTHEVFTLHYAHRKYIDLLSYEEKGRLFEMIFHYASTGEEPKTKDIAPVVLMAFYLLCENLSSHLV